MNVKNNILLSVIFLSFLLSACTTPQTPIANDDAGLSANDQLLAKGYALLERRNTKEAIDTSFDPVIENCNQLYRNSETAIYASRSLKETLFYLGMAASKDIDSEVIDTTCADALYARAYASLDLGQVEVAQQFIEQAIAMSPLNAFYLSELGHIHHVNRDWQQALAVFSQAEEYAETFTPDDLKPSELARAKRGVGFSLIELGRLDEARAKFEECLAIDPNDKTAQNEIRYIESLAETHTDNDIDTAKE